MVRVILDGDIPDIEEELEVSGGVGGGHSGASGEAHLTRGGCPGDGGLREAGGGGRLVTGRGGEVVGGGAGGRHGGAGRGGAGGGGGAPEGARGLAGLLGGDGPGGGALSLQRVFAVTGMRLLLTRRRLGNLGHQLIQILPIVLAQGS